MISRLTPTGAKHCDGRDRCAGVGSVRRFHAWLLRLFIALVAPISSVAQPETKNKGENLLYSICCCLFLQSACSTKRLVVTTEGLALVWTIECHSTCDGAGIYLSCGHTDTAAPNRSTTYQPRSFQPVVSGCTTHTTHRLRSVDPMNRCRYRDVKASFPVKWP